MGNLWLDSVVGEFGMDAKNVSGKLMMEMCLQNELVIFNSLLKKRDIHMKTVVYAKFRAYLTFYPSKH